MNRKLLSVVILIILLLGRTVYAADHISQVISDHLEQALIYEQKAAEQDVLIADQKQKMVDYKATYRIDEERHSTGRIEAMERHCEAVIKSAEKLKKEFLDFAAWHRKQAAELQKKSKVSSSKERNG